MQLHPHVSAQRSASANSECLVSVTLGALPPQFPLTCKEVVPGHWLVIVRNGEDYERVALAYAFGSQVPPWISARVYHVVGVTNPAHSWQAYLHTRWWRPKWPVGPASVRLLEGVGEGLITPWRHHWLS